MYNSLKQKSNKMSIDTPAHPDQNTELNDKFVADAAHRIVGHTTEGTPLPTRDSFEMREAFHQSDWEQTVARDRVYEEESHAYTERAYKQQAAVLNETIKDKEAALIQMSRALTKAEYAASHDMQTGLYNRAAFTYIVEHETGHINREGDADAVSQFVFVDLDDFKQINSDFGYDGGDEFLAAVASTLDEELKDHLVARWGGEEFVILLRNLNTEEATEVVTNIRRLLNNTQIRGRQIRASFGIAEQKQGRSWHHTRDNANIALFEAKHMEDKNAIVIYEEGMQYGSQKDDTPKRRKEDLESTA